MDNGSAPRLRHAVIGAGAGVMKAHGPALLSQGVDLVAVTDTNEDLGRSRAVEFGCGLEVSLPLDRSRYASMLEELGAASVRETT